jgi:hypothetical protein
VLARVMINLSKKISILINFDKLFNFFFSLNFVKIFKFILFALLLYFFVLEIAEVSCFSFKGLNNINQNNFLKKYNLKNNFEVFVFGNVHAEVIYNNVQTFLSNSEIWSSKIVKLIPKGLPIDYKFSKNSPFNHFHIIVNVNETFASQFNTYVYGLECTHWIYDDIFNFRELAPTDIMGEKKIQIVDLRLHAFEKNIVDFQNLGNDKLFKAAMFNDKYTLPIIECLRYGLGDC